MRTVKNTAKTVTVQRTRVAEAMNRVIDVARTNDVGPIALSDLLLSMAAAFCKQSGVSREQFVRASEKHYDEYGAMGQSELKH